MLGVPARGEVSAARLTDGPICARDLHSLPRAWVCSLLATLEPEFEPWVKERIDARCEKLAEDNNKMIEVEPAIARCFEASKNISSK